MKKLVLGHPTVLFSLNSDWMDTWMDGEVNQMMCQTPIFPKVVNEVSMCLCDFQNEEVRGRVYR